MKSKMPVPPKIKWKVSPIPSRWDIVCGHKRSWPYAFYQNDNIAARIVCAAEYEPSYVKTGEHPELMIKITYWIGDSSEWRILTKRAKTVAEAKQMFADFLKENFQKISPKEYRGM